MIEIIPLEQEDETAFSLMLRLPCPNCGKSGMVADRKQGAWFEESDLLIAMLQCPRCRFVHRLDLGLNADVAN